MDATPESGHRESRPHCVIATRVEKRSTVREDGEVPNDQFVQAVFERGERQLPETSFPLTGTPFREPADDVLRRTLEGDPHAGAD